MMKKEILLMLLAIGYVANNTCSEKNIDSKKKKDCYFVTQGIEKDKKGNIISAEERPCHVLKRIQNHKGSTRFEDKRSILVGESRSFDPDSDLYWSYNFEDDDRIDILILDGKKYRENEVPNGAYLLSLYRSQNRKLIKCKVKKELRGNNEVISSKKREILIFNTDNITSTKEKFLTQDKPKFEKEYLSCRYLITFKNSHDATTESRYSVLFTGQESNVLSCDELWEKYMTIAPSGIAVDLKKVLESQQ